MRIKHLIIFTGLLTSMMNMAKAAESKNISPQEPTTHSAQQQLADELKTQPSWLSEAYASIDYKIIWSEGSAPSKSFNELIKLLKAANRQGLKLNDYPINRLKSLINSDPIKREVFTAKVYSNYLHDLVAGKTNPLIDYSDSFAEQRLIEKGEIITAAFKDKDPIEYLHKTSPDNFIVERLLDALSTYRSYQGDSNWLPIEMTTRKLDLGMQDKAVEDIRNRLRVEGFLDQMDESTNPMMYDETVATGVKAFQKSRSMLDDGIVGESTIAALNEPLSSLIQKLVINIERARWLPSALGSRAVLVNIADYKLRLFEQEELVDTINVVVGTEQNETVVFAENMKHVVINPYWNIPRSIVQNELAVDMQKDPQYLQMKNIEVLSGWEDDATVIDDSTIDWNLVATGDFSFRLRQKPGKENALGLIKFLFPNDHAIYLHDTPAEALFNKDKRAFSHGCIRVEEPIKLADFVFKNNPEWDGELVQNQIDTKAHLSINLDEEIPVYISYFTAWSDPQGTVYFARDIYDRDDKLIKRFNNSISN